MQTAEEFSVSMPLDMANDIRAVVEAGEFPSTSDAIRDAIRVWRRQRLEDAERLKVIRARIRRSLDDPRPNMCLEEVDARLAARFAEAQRASGDAPSKG
jgi:antitoxin ParD1/3/4